MLNKINDSSLDVVADSRWIFGTHYASTTTSYSTPELSIPTTPEGKLLIITAEVAAIPTASVFYSTPTIIDEDYIDVKVTHPITGDILISDGFYVAMSSSLTLSGTMEEGVSEMSTANITNFFSYDKTYDYIADKYVSYFPPMEVLQSSTTSMQVDISNNVTRTVDIKYRLKAFYIDNPFV